MLTIRERLGHNATAVGSGADLGGAVRVDSLDQRTGSSGLVRQHVQELRPGGVSHTLAHVTAAEAQDVQVLDSDEVILPHQGADSWC